MTLVTEAVNQNDGMMNNLLKVSNLILNIKVFHHNCNKSFFFFSLTIRIVNFSRLIKNLCEQSTLETSLYGVTSSGKTGFGAKHPTSI